MQTLTFYEYDGFVLADGTVSTKTTELPIETATADRLLDALSEDKHPLAKIFTLKGRNVKASHFVGAVRFENIQLIILPKISKSKSNTFQMENINFMLEKAYNIKVQTNNVTELNSADGDFVEYQMRHFANRLSYEIKRGINREFASEESEKKFLKGKLNFPKTLRAHLKGKNTFITKSFVFSEDNLINHLLKWTCYQLHRTTKSDSTKSQLQYCMDSFADVSDVVPTDNHFSRILFNRSNERYQDLINLARLVYEGEQIVLESGVNRINGLIFDMNKLFEGFIATALKETLPAIVTMSEQTEFTYATNAAQKHNVQIKPDIVVSHGSTLVVMDTKYKIISGNDETVSNSDVFQISTYKQHFLKSFKTVKAILIYPQYDTEIKADFVDGQGKNEFEVMTITLAGDLRANYPEICTKLHGHVSKLFQDALVPKSADTRVIP